MLILSRRRSESIKIGSDITVTVVSVHRGAVRIGITAPRHVRIDREEIRERLLLEQEEPADADCDE